MILKICSVWGLALDSSGGGAIHKLCNIISYSGGDVNRSPFPANPAGSLSPSLLV